MRQYEEIWTRLKNLPRKDAEIKGISISAPRALHKRIIKATKKEKWKDHGYKAIEPRRAVLSVSRSNSIVTFRLTFSLIEEDF